MFAIEGEDVHPHVAPLRVRFSEAAPVPVLATRKPSARREGIRLGDLFQKHGNELGDEETRAEFTVTSMSAMAGPVKRPSFWDRIRPPPDEPVFRSSPLDRDAQPVENDAPHLSYIEFLHRYNVLYSRAKLLRHFEARRDLVDNDVSEQIFLDLKAHSTAIRDYHDFRAEENLIFKARNLDNVIQKMVTMDAIEAKIADLEAAEAAPEVIAEELEKLEKIQEEISTAFLKVLRSTTSGLSRKKKYTESRALLTRLFMAIGGGLALIAPMLIMVLHPTKLTAILTTSCFVFVIAIALAVFMADSQPMDIIGFTAAYAAVLVVFIGTGGSTGA